MLVGFYLIFSEVSLLLSWKNFKPFYGFLHLHSTRQTKPFVIYEEILMLQRCPSSRRRHTSWPGSYGGGAPCSRHHPWAAIRVKERETEHHVQGEYNGHIADYPTRVLSSVHLEIYENIWTNLTPEYKNKILSSVSSVAFEQLVKVRSKFSCVTYFEDFGENFFHGHILRTSRVTS